MYVRMRDAIEDTKTTEAPTVCVDGGEISEIAGCTTACVDYGVRQQRRVTTRNHGYHGDLPPSTHTEVAATITEISPPSMHTVVKALNHGDLAAVDAHRSQSPQSRRSRRRRCIP